MLPDSNPEPFHQFQKSWVFPASVWGIATLFFFWFEYITLTQYLANRIFTVDAGMFDYMCSSLRHGHFMTFPLAWEAEVNIFADHFRPIFLVIALAYFIVDNIMTLLTFFNAALVFAAVPLAYYSRKITRHEALSILIILIYLTNVFTRSIHLAMHAEALIPLGFFLLFLSIGLRKTWLFWFSAAYLFSNKEDIPLYLGALSFIIYIEQFFVSKKDDWLKKQSGFLLIASILMFVVAFGTMKFAGMDRLAETMIDPMEKFKTMGDSKLEVIQYMLTHPIEIAAKIFKPAIFYLLFSLGGLALLDWKRIPVAIGAASIFLIVDGPVGELNYYYSYAALPLVFVSSIIGIQFLQEKIKNTKAFHISLFIIFGGILIFQVFQPTRTDGLYQLPFEPDPRHEMIPEIVSLIPDDATVVAQFDLYVHVPNRPIKLPLSVDYLELADFVFLDSQGIVVVPKENIPKIIEIISSDDFKVAFEGDGFQLLERVRE